MSVGGGWTGNQEAGPSQSQMSPLGAFSPWLTAAPWWQKWDPQAKALGGVGCGCHLPEVTGQSQGVTGGPVPSVAARPAAPSPPGISEPCPRCPGHGPKRSVVNGVNFQIFYAEGHT